MSFSNVTLITPPDKLFNMNLSYLLVCPSPKVQMQFQQITSIIDEDVNVYVYDNHNDIDWLLSVARQVDVTIIDIDGCNDLTRDFVSCLLINPQTFYLTSQDHTPWELLNKNRIYNLDWIIQQYNTEEDSTDDDE